MGGDAGSYEIMTAALGLLTAMHADRRMAGPVTVDYLAGVPTDRSRMLSLAAGMTALATVLIQIRSEETGAAPEETLAESGRRIQQFRAGGAGEDHRRDVGSIVGDGVPGGGRGLIPLAV